MLKNSCRKSKPESYSYQVGLNAEIETAKCLSQKAWQLLFHRLKTRIAEVDLILQKENQIRLVEVKTLDNAWRAFDRISSFQIEKLIQNQISMARLSFRYEVSAWIAWVGPKQIEYSRVN